MIGMARALWTILALSGLSLLTAATADAQPVQGAVELVDPSALRFEAPAVAGEPTRRYVVELFRYEDGREVEPSVRKFERDSDATDAGTVVRLDIADTLAGLPAGVYIASVHPVGTGDPSWNGKTVPFVAGTSPEEAANERFWIRVAIAIGAGILLIPFLLR